MPSYDQKKTSISLNNIQSYFDNLNPIAELIAKDIRNTKANYGHLWNSFSISEQDDIINETLIKPELSLRYFDSFSVTPETNSRSSTSKSLSASDDSLAAVVLKNINYAATSKDKGKDEVVKDKKPNLKKHKGSSHGNIKNYYSFDGRNLTTYSIQKAALKFIQDDVIGTYRDEHSMPFSYKTQSQINLHLFSNLPKNDGGPPSSSNHLQENVSNVKHDRALIENYVKLQKELKMSLQKENGGSRKSSISATTTTSTPTAVNTTASKVKPRPQVKPPPVPPPTTKKASIVDTKKLEDFSVFDNQNDNRIISKVTEQKSIISSGAPTIYSDTYFDNNENANLMMHASNYAASSSSAVTSDEDDEKTICEEVKLLNNDANLRKGFDFLNNW